MTDLDLKCQNGHQLRLYPIAGTKRLLCNDCKKPCKERCHMCLACEHYLCKDCRLERLEALRPPVRRESTTPSNSTPRSKLVFRGLPNLGQILAKATADTLNDGSKCPQGHVIRVLPLPNTKKVICGECDKVVKGKGAMCTLCSDYVMCLDCQTAYAKAAQAILSAQPVAPTRGASAHDLRGACTLRSALVKTDLEKWRQDSEEWVGGWDTMVELLRCDNEDDIGALGGGELLGQGKYGMVHRIRDPKTGRHQVIKTCLASPGWGSARLTLEAKILQNLDHPHILRIFSWFEYGDAVSIIMDNCGGGELLKVVRAGRAAEGQVPEPWGAAALRQSFGALSYIHSKGLVHKDLKGPNILLHSANQVFGRVFSSIPHVIICDFGLAELCQESSSKWFGGGDKAKHVAGTPATRAPEVVKGSFSFKADIWSMGVVMFEIFAGELPFVLEGASVSDLDAWNSLYRKGPDWGRFPSTLQGRTGDAQALCSRMLTVKETIRPTAIECLEHPWTTTHKRSNLSKYDIDAMTEAIKAWRNKTALQQAICLWIVASPAGAECLRKFATLFTQLDADNVGVLNLERAAEGLQQLGMSAEDARGSAKGLDLNGDGSCEYLEFSAGCLASLEERYDELLVQNFLRLDREGRGVLTMKDMHPVIEFLSPLISNMEFLMKEMSTISSSNGTTSFADFCKHFGRDEVDYERLRQRIQGPEIDPDSPESPKKGDSNSTLKQKKERKIKNQLREKNHITSPSANATAQNSDVPDRAPTWTLPLEPKSRDNSRPSSDSDDALVPCTPSKPSFFYPKAKASISSVLEDPEHRRQQR